MHIYYHNKTMTNCASRYRYSGREYLYLANQNSDLPYTSKRATPQGIRPPIPYKQSKRKEEEVVSLTASIIRTAAEASKPFKNRDTPLTTRVICLILGVGVVQLVFSLVNIVTQLTGPFMSLVYTVSGISASIIVIHDFERNRKNRSRSVPKSTEALPVVNRHTKRTTSMTGPFNQMGISPIAYHQRYKSPRSSQKHKTLRLH